MSQGLTGKLVCRENRKIERKREIYADRERETERQRERGRGKDGETD